MRLLAGEACGTIRGIWCLQMSWVDNKSHFTVYIHFKRIVRELGMPEERFHDLRQSFAVASIERR